eukprot:6253829-Pyramimonas_sp.AAC.1
MGRGTRATRACTRHAACATARCGPVTTITQCTSCPHGNAPVARRRAGKARRASKEKCVAGAAPQFAQEKKQ